MYHQGVRKTVTVELEESAHPGHFFVMVRNVPFVRGGLVITDARPLDKAKRIKARVEQALKAFPKSFDPSAPLPKEGPKRLPPTRFSRITKRDADGRPPRPDDETEEPSERP